MSARKGRARKRFGNPDEKADEIETYGSYQFLGTYSYTRRGTHRKDGDEGVRSARGHILGKETQAHTSDVTEGDCRRRLKQKSLGTVGTWTRRRRSDSVIPHGQWEWAA